jgi:hypothetical protein
MDNGKNNMGAGDQIAAMPFITSLSRVRRGALLLQGRRKAMPLPQGRRKAMPLPQGRRKAMPLPQGRRKAMPLQGRRKAMPLPHGHGSQEEKESSNGPGLCLGRQIRAPEITEEFGYPA